MFQREPSREVFLEINYGSHPCHVYLDVLAKAETKEIKSKRKGVDS